LKAGVLRHRLAFASATESRDAAGGVTKSWSTYATLWGSITVKSGREKMEAPGPISNHEVEVKIRYNSSVGLEHRITHDSRVYEINSIDNWEERNIYMVLRCTELKNE